MRPAAESDRTYIQRLNFLTDVFGDESGEIDESSITDLIAYVDHWDPERDGGVIAFDEYRTPAGGVWLRHWQDPEEGHANLSPEVPELALAVENRFHGHALGAKLLQAACDLARSQGAQRIVLFVDPDNPRARHRYEEFGFTDYDGKDVSGKDVDDVMILPL